MAWTAPKTWVDNVDSLSATNLNTHLRDNLTAMSAWTAYTPAWAGTGGTPAVGNGSLSGSYIKYGSLCFFRIQLTWGSSTTANSATAWTFSLPFAYAGLWSPISVSLSDVGSATYPAVGVFTTSTTFLTRTTAGTAVGATTPHTWANTDIYSASGFYEV